MAKLFQPGIVFQSDSEYLADRSLYTIELSDTQPRSHIILEETVPVAFQLRNLRNVTIDLGGATLLFNGRILPFLLENCKNVTLRNFTIDYRRAAYTQAEILDADQDHLTLKVCEGFPCLYRDGEIIPVDGDRECDTHNGNMLLQPFDAVTRAPAYNAGCILAVIGSNGEMGKNPPLAIQRLRSEFGPNGTVIWHGNFPASYRRGQMLAFTHESRATPGIYACDCENTVVEHVRMKRVAGFGIHGYFCRDFTVRGTRGMYEEATNSVFLDAAGDEKFDFNWQTEKAGNAEAYAEQYEHPVWKQYLQEGVQGTHDGMDWLEFTTFFDCLEQGKPMPVDVYDAATWMAVTALSEQSIATGSAQVAFPDFTRGKWLSEEF